MSAPNRNYVDCDPSRSLHNSGVTTGIVGSRNAAPCHAAPNQTGYPAHTFDPASFHLLKQSLLKKPLKPYGGEPHLYQTFVNQLSSNLKGIQLDPWEYICVLEAQTTGKPQQIVQSYMVNGSANPTESLRLIQHELATRFGSGSRVANYISSQVEALSPIKSVHQCDKLEELLEICKLIRTNLPFLRELELFNNSSGIYKLWSKLPDPFQNQWRSIYSEYKGNHGFHPPFEVFLNFLTKRVSEYNDPVYEKHTHESARPKRDHKTYKTEAVEDEECSVGEPPLETCFLHPTSKHELHECRAFIKSDDEEKSRIMKEFKICFRCLGNHFSSKCHQNVKCETCGNRHLTILHRGKNPMKNDGKMKPKKLITKEKTSSMCSTICGSGRSGLSCSKTVLVEVWIPGSTRPCLRCYAILDDQSNSSFADSKVAAHFGIHSPVVDYTLKTLSTDYKTKMSGIYLEGLKIKGVGERRSYRLPSILTNDSIPENKDEVATPDIVASHPHAERYARYFNRKDEQAKTLFLLGRDFGEAMFCRCFGQKAPFVYRTRLGWALVGSICSSSNNDKKALRSSLGHEHFYASMDFGKRQIDYDSHLATNSYDEHPNDEDMGLSRDDKRFMDSVRERIHVNEEGNITLPLPFKVGRRSLPDNRLAVLNRSVNTLDRIKRDSPKLRKCLDAMQSNLDANHVEKVPANEIKSKSTHGRWYIPVFPVVNKKREKVRLVFDSSATFKGSSLNNQLLSGPDLNNRLRTVLLRFRRGKVAFSADIQSMFYCFHLEPGDRDLTRFFWFRENDPNNDLVEFRARVHLFGNTSSPALATMGLLYAVNNGVNPAPEEVKLFVHNHFYVDDGLMSVDTIDDAVRILRETRIVLEKFKIRLHKITCNEQEVLDYFPPSELSEPKAYIAADKITQQTLGLTWDINNDVFVIKTEVPCKSFTKRGILATINSVFDPLGFAAPIILAGRLIQRKMITAKHNMTVELRDL